MAHPKECFEEKALNTPGLKCSICDERYLQKSGKAFFTVIYCHSSCSRLAVQLSESRQAVVRQWSGSRQAVVRRLSGSQEAVGSVLFRAAISYKGH